MAEERLSENHREEHDKRTNIEDLSESEIAERVERLKTKGEGNAKEYAMMVFLGLGLTMTVIGAIIGIPLLILGLFGLMGRPFGWLIDTTDDAIRGSPWAGTGLEYPPMTEHRKANKELDFQCPNCGLFAGLRHVSDSPEKTIQCTGCGAVYERALSEGGLLGRVHWRLIDGDSERVGEAHDARTWHSLRRSDSS